MVLSSARRSVWIKLTVNIYFDFAMGLFGMVRTLKRLFGPLEVSDFGSNTFFCNIVMWGVQSIAMGCTGHMWLF